MAVRSGYFEKVKYSNRSRFRLEPKKENNRTGPDFQALMTLSSNRLVARHPLRWELTRMPPCASFVGNDAENSCVGIVDEGSPSGLRLGSTRRIRSSLSCWLVSERRRIRPS